MPKRRPAPFEHATADAPALRAGARAHFLDPVYYAHCYRQRHEDVVFYTSFVPTGARVLEYGAGEGRIALPLARSGASVVGVDWAAPMVARARERLAGESKAVRARVRFVDGDMRQLRLRAKFDFVLCTFNTALHLYGRTDVEAFLARVRSHLAPGGQFVCDLSVPQVRDLARDPDQPHATPRFRHPTSGEVVRYREYFHYDSASQVLDVSMVFTPVARPDAEFVVPLSQRQYFPREWEALLHYNGFRTVALFGGFDRRAFDGDSDTMIWVAEQRREARSP